MSIFSGVLSIIPFLSLLFPNPSGTDGITNFWFEKYANSCYVYPVNLLSSVRTVRLAADSLAVKISPPPVPYVASNTYQRPKPEYSPYDTLFNQYAREYGTSAET